jgi:hypothetical protein
MFAGGKEKYTTPSEVQRALCKRRKECGAQKKTVTSDQWQVVRKSADADSKPDVHKSNMGARKF